MVSLSEFTTAIQGGVMDEYIFASTLSSCGILAKQGNDIWALPDLDGALTRNGVGRWIFNMSNAGLGGEIVGGRKSNILKPWVSDIRVKRNGEYLVRANGGEPQPEWLVYECWCSAALHESD